MVVYQWSEDVPSLAAYRRDFQTGMNRTAVYHTDDPIRSQCCDCISHFRNHQLACLTSTACDLEHEIMARRMRTTKEKVEDTVVSGSGHDLSPISPEERSKIVKVRAGKEIVFTVGVGASRKLT